MQAETIHSRSPLTGSQFEASATCPFDDEGLGVHLCSPTQAMTKLPNGTFSHEKHSLVSLLNDPALRAEIIFDDLPIDTDASMAGTSQPRINDGDGALIVTEDHDQVYVHLTPLGTSGAIDFLQRNDASWLFECESGFPLKLKGPFAAADWCYRNDVAWLERFALPAWTQACPEPAALYLQRFLGMKPTDLPQSVFLCGGCTFRHGPNGRSKSAFFLFQYLHDRNSERIGVVGVALNMDGSPITGAGETSSTCMLLPQVEPTDLYFAELQEANVCIAVDFHSALRIGHLAKLPSIATGTYSALSEVQFPMDREARGDILVTRDEFQFENYAKEFARQYESKWDWRLNLASLNQSEDTGTDSKRSPSAT